MIKGDPTGIAFLVRKSFAQTATSKRIVLRRGKCQCASAHWRCQIFLAISKFTDIFTLILSCSLLTNFAISSKNPSIFAIFSLA